MPKQATKLSKTCKEPLLTYSYIRFAAKLYQIICTKKMLYEALPTISKGKNLNFLHFLSKNDIIGKIYRQASMLVEVQKVQIGGM